MADGTNLTAKRLSSITNDRTENVERLDVSGMGLSTMEDISACVELKRLNLSQNELTTLSGLGNCGQLTWLNVSKNNLESLSGIQSLRKLTVLNASHNSIQTLYHVANLSNLKALVLNNNSISAVQDLGKLKNLNTLVLSHNSMQEVNVSALVGLTKLSLSHNQLKSVPDLKSNQTLKELRLNDNRIATLPANTDLNRRLTLLDLGNNKINNLSDIRGLCKLSFLKNLNLKGNPVCSTVESYRSQILAMVPSLDVLDGRKVNYLEKFGGKFAHKTEDAQDRQGDSDQEEIQSFSERQKINSTKRKQQEDARPSEKNTKKRKSLNKECKPSLDGDKNNADKEPRNWKQDATHRESSHERKKAKYPNSAGSNELESGSILELPMLLEDKFVDESDSNVEEKRKKKKDKKQHKVELGKNHTKQYKEMEKHAVKAEVEEKSTNKRRANEAISTDYDVQKQAEKTRPEGDAIYTKTLHKIDKARRKKPLKLEESEDNKGCDNLDLLPYSKESEFSDSTRNRTAKEAERQSKPRGLPSLGNSRSSVLAIVKNKRTAKRKKEGQNTGDDFELMLKSSALYSEIGGGKDSSW